jgi:tetratricopeptide (TPR) repeat protein
VIAGAASAGIACIVLTSIQLPVWSDSESLFRHAIQVTSRNYLALHNMGSALLEKPDRLQEAVEDLQASLVIKPDSAAVLTDLGTAFAKMGRFLQAIAEYERALRISPTSEITRRDLAEARINAAVSESNLAAELARDPSHFDQAVVHYEAALVFDPDSADTHYNLGVTLEKLEGRSNDAIAEFEAALRLNPNYPEAHNDLGVALTRSRLPDAIAHFEAALRTRPDYADAHYNLGVALSEVPGRLPDAIAQFEAAQRLNPDPEIKRILERLRRR